jgi:hypothetical protein
MRHQRRPTAVLSRGTATGIAHIAVRTVPLKRLTTTGATLLTRTETVVSSSGLANREIGVLAGRRRLALDTRQLRANQRTMNGALVGRRLALSFLMVGVLLRSDRFITTLDLIRLCGYREHFFDHIFMLGTGHADAFRFLRIVDDLLGRHGCDGRQDGRRLGFLSLARHTRVLVFMIRVARRATRLFDVLTDHGDDDVIRQTPLARTVVIQNVTRPKLALLHQELPMDPRWRGKEVRKVRQS